MAFHEDNPTKTQLLEMGYDEYMVNQSIKYVSINNDQQNDDNLLLDAMDWLSNHEITEHETKNNNINKICNIIECARYQALYALQQSQNNMQQALNLLVNANLNSSIIASPDNNNQQQQGQDNIFSNLSQENIQNLQMEDSILSATILSIEEERKKEQQFKVMKPVIVSELRSMGFLQIAANQAVNDKSVKDRKSAIQYILSHPMNSIQEKHAKIQEITNSGYSENEALTALNRYSQNLNMAMSWLMQGKPSKIKHFMYHVETKSVIQIPINNNINASMLELSEKINFKNISQQWSFYEDGKIKNFANNKILIVKCNKNEMSYNLEIIYDDFMGDINNDNDDNKENINTMNGKVNKEEMGIYKYWEIDINEKTIKNKECGLYLVYRSDSGKKFYLEKNIHIGDMSQRWCFVDENELTKLNPKELAKLLDSSDYECIICWENEPNLRLEPCGHSSFCQSCINELKPTECPVCRTKVHTSRRFDND